MATKLTWTLFVISWIQVLMFGGVMFNWQAFIPILKDEGQYAELCFERPLPGESCNEQDLRYNLIFVSAFFSFNICTFVGGTFLDYFGPKITVSLGSFLSSVAILLFAFSDSQTFDAFLIAGITWGIGGPMIYFGIIHVANLFVDRKNTALTAYSGSWSGAGAIFVLISAIYFSSSISRKTIFVVYFVFAFLSFIISVFLWPYEAYEENSTAAIDYKFWKDPHLKTKASALNPLRLFRKSQVSSMIHLDNHSDENDKSDYEKNGKKDAEEKLFKSYSFKNQIFTSVYFGICYFIIVSLMEVSWFLGTGSLQLLEKGDENDQYLKLFTIFNFLGILGVLPLGYIMDHYGIVSALVVTWILHQIWCFVNMFGSLQWQILSFLLFPLWRTGTWSCFMASLRLYFGVKNIGKLVGIAVVISAFLNFAGNSILKLTVNTFHSNFIYANLFYMSLNFLSILFPLHLSRKNKKIIK